MSAMPAMSGVPISDGRRRVVVVGGGFGGLTCARALDGAPVDVLLIDARNYHLFTPLLYHVATALLDPSDIAYPFRTIFRRSRNVRFRQALVTGVDFEAKRVRTHGGPKIGYDTLVLATGSINAYFGNPDLAERTIGMKSLDEALRLRNHVLSCLERAAQTSDPGERAEWLTFVIVGGGPTGVEYSGALAELLGMVLGRDFPELAPDDVWSAGVRPNDPLDPEAGERSRTGRLVVDDHLRLRATLPGDTSVLPDVYAIGDVASVSSGPAAGELPMLSPPAMQEGRYVAGMIRGEITRPVRYRDKGTMAAIGRRAAVAEVGPLRLRGALGWVTWLVVHLYYVIGFRNRLVVLASWAWDYLRRDRPVRLVVRSHYDPIAAGLVPDDEPEPPPDPDDRV